MLFRSVLCLLPSAFCLLPSAPTVLAVTIRTAIQSHEAFLASKGVESPRLQVELLLAHLLKLPRLQLYLDLDREVPQRELGQLEELVQRRAERVPLQHLIGSVSFNGLELEVNGDVLIPRPETEILAQLAVQRLSDQKKPAPVALDFGCGSGCLAIALAVGVPGAMVHAIDCSEAALAVARRNAQRHGVAERIRFHLGDGFAALPETTQPFDLLVSNPPYISTSEIATLDPEVRDHDPRLALDGGADGLDFYRRLAAEAPAFLLPGAPGLLEFGDAQEDDLRRLFSGSDWVFEAIENDLSGRPRIVIARRAT